MSDEKLDTQVRREQIAEAALGLIASQGLRALNMAAVARRVGLVPSGIYRHFKSKDQIIEAVLELLRRRILDNVEAARREHTNPLARLRDVLIRHVRFIREGRAIPRIIFSEDLHGGHPDRKNRVRQILDEYMGHVAEFVREGQQQGLIRPDLDPGTVALMFLGMIVPAGILWHLSDGGFDVTRHAQRAWEMFQKAIVVEKGTGTVATSPFP